MYIACQSSDGYVTIEEIVRTRKISEKYLAKLLGELVRGGLLTSRRGQEGGFKLLRPASEVTLLEIIRVLEGPMAINKCMGVHPTCQWTETCPMRETWQELQDTIEMRLSSVSLAALANEELVTQGIVADPSPSPW
jgi:Rrf2 family protein